VVLFANEEFGLSGARAYAAAHSDELAAHVAAVEADLGAGAVWSFTSGVEAGQLPKVEALARLLAPLGIEPGNNDGRGGADLIPIASSRVPQFGLWQDASQYFDLHHTEDDTLAMVDPAGLKQNLAAHAVFAYFAAEVEGGFGRAPEPKPAP
jgi:Zn-dependent M28 family amino/carboxypeptidase